MQHVFNQFATKALSPFGFISGLKSTKIIKKNLATIFTFSKSNMNRKQEMTEVVCGKGEIVNRPGAFPILTSDR